MDSFKLGYPKEDYLTMLQFVIIKITLARIYRNELYIDIAIQPVKAIEFIHIPIRIPKHIGIQQHPKKFEIKLMKKGRFLLSFFYGIKTHYKEKLVILINKCNVNPNSGL